MTRDLRGDITDNLFFQSVCIFFSVPSLLSLLLNVTPIGIRKWDKKKQQEGEQLKNPSRTIAVIERLQTVIAPQEFNPRGVYDGAVNFFTLKNMSQSKVLALW